MTPQSDTDYVLVPVEPTKEMLDAGDALYVDGGPSALETWRAMVKVTPINQINTVISSLRAERAKHVKELATLRAELAEAKRREDEARNDAHRLRDELNAAQQQSERMTKVIQQLDYAQ